MGLIFFGILFCALMMLIGAFIYAGLTQKFPETIDVLMGLSAGLLLGIIFLGIIPEATEMIHESFATYHDSIGLITILAVGAGALFIIIFERLLPVQHHHDLDHELRHNEIEEHSNRRNLPLVLLVAFGLHSFFELFSILIVGEANVTLAWGLILVIGLHNIPIGFIILSQLEGFGVSQKKSFLYIIFLALAEAMAAVIFYLLLSTFITDAIQGIVLGATSGMMLYIVFDELLPEIYGKTEQHHINYAVIIGVLLMLFFLTSFGHSH